MPCQHSASHGGGRLASNSPDGHTLLAGRDGALHPQGAAPTPGVLQAAAGAQPAPALRIEGLDLLGAQVVPRPGLFLLQDGECWAAGSQEQDLLPPPSPGGRSQAAPCTHLPSEEHAGAHSHAEGGGEGQRADAMRGQVVFQQAPEPGGKGGHQSRDLRCSHIGQSTGACSAHLSSFCRKFSSPRCS